jgi:hypothetical protein
LKLEEKAMATNDKIQVSRNEGSVLGTRRLWSSEFQVSKISRPWFRTWKKKGRKEEEEGMAGRMTRASICLSVSVFCETRRQSRGYPLVMCKASIPILCCNLGLILCHVS